MIAVTDSTRSYGFSASGSSPPPNYTLSGAITGLRNGLTVTLGDNSSDSLAVVGAGAFSTNFQFATSIASGSVLGFKVLSPQPLGQFCTLVNPSVFDTSYPKITGVVVTCNSQLSVAVNVSGLAIGNSLTLTLTDPAFVGFISQATLGNGSYAFPANLTGDPYSVTIVTQPGGQTCTIANPTGTAINNFTFMVNVTCH